MKARAWSLTWGRLCLLLSTRGVLGRDPLLLVTLFMSNLFLAWLSSSLNTNTLYLTLHHEHPVLTWTLLSHSHYSWRCTPRTHSPSPATPPPPPPPCCWTSPRCQTCYQLLPGGHWVLSEELILYRVDGAKYFLCRQNLIEMKSCFKASAYLCSCESDLWVWSPPWNWFHPRHWTPGPQHQQTAETLQPAAIIINHHYY